MRENGRRGLQVPLAQCQRLLAQGVVRAPRGRYPRVGVPAGPRLDAGVEIHRALLPAELDQRDRRHVDRDIEQEVAATEHRIEDAADILARQRLTHELDAEVIRACAPLVIGGDDADAILRDSDVAQDQWQDTLTDATESDKKNSAGEIDVDLVFGHDRLAC